MPDRCPFCPGTRFYRLGDGRWMCAGCRRRFASGPRRSRLTPETAAKLIRAFWQGDSAAAAARSTRVNVKTAHRYFRRIRLALAADAALGEQHPTAQSSIAALEPERRRVAVFGIQEGIRSIRVLMPGEAMRLGGARNASISWVFAPSLEAARTLRVASFFRIPRSDEVRLWHGKAQISRADSFWRFATARLKTYRGGYRHAFGLYLKEMAFRFNHRGQPEADQLLLRRLLGQALES